MSILNKFGFIYFLVDPRTFDIRYVGKTVQTLGRRLNSHVYEASTGKYNHHCACWIRSLLAVGLSPNIIHINYCHDTQLCEKEKEWIKSLKFIGVNLTNTTDGGEGVLGWKPSKEQCNAISKRQTGRKLTEHHKQKISAGGKGKHTGSLSEEHKNRLSLSHKGYKHTLEQTEKIRVANTGRKLKPFTDEHKKNMSASHKGKPAWNKGKKKK